MITPEQQQVLDSVFQRNNTFMYGAGGVGKSFCIHQITKWCNENEHKVGITATTGSAAFLIGGTTIHSFLGIGVPDKKPPFLVADHVKKKRKDIVKKLAKLDILVIDEISMMSSNLFDFISVYLSIVRECDMPFGGVQIVLSGDVYQLPPCDGEFVFKAEVWNDANFSSYELIKSHRHKGDTLFSRILQELRIGICTDETLKILRATADVKIRNATCLFTTNVSVDEINKAKMDNLITKTGEEQVTFKNKNYNTPFGKQGKVPENVNISKGCTVMLTYNVNLDRGLCNGAQGTVLNIQDDIVTIKFFNGKTADITFIKVTCPEDDKKWVEFMPLRLAYAITINKSQGMTLDRAIIVLDDSKVKSYGRAYTALSRVRTLDNLSIRGKITKEMFQPHPDVLAWERAEAQGRPRDGATPYGC